MEQLIRPLGERARLISFHGNSHTDIFIAADTLFIRRPNVRGGPRAGEGDKLPINQKLNYNLRLMAR